VCTSVCVSVCPDRVLPLPLPATPPPPFSDLSIETVYFMPLTRDPHSAKAIWSISNWTTCSASKPTSNR